MTKQLELSPGVKVLVRARDLVEKGWGQGTYVQQGWLGSRIGRKYCAEGALREAAREIEPVWTGGGWGVGYGQAEWALIRVLRERYGVMSVGIVGFNDRAETTQAGVLRLFDEAIAEEMGVPAL